jgi:hypothetical protein
MSAEDLLAELAQFTDTPIRSVVLQQSWQRSRASGVDPREPPPAAFLRKSSGAARRTIGS